jgi:hypothetical protein
MKARDQQGLAGINTWDVLYVFYEVLIRRRQRSELLEMLLPRSRQTELRVKT